MITNAEGKVLVSKDGTNALSNETVGAAKSDPAGRILNTSDGSTYQLLNAATKTNLDVDNSGTTVGTKVGLWQSPSGTSPSANQTWTLRNVTPTSQKTVNVQTAVNEKAALPTEVTLYYTWGEGKATVANWDTLQGRCGQRKAPTKPPLPPPMCTATSSTSPLRSTLARSPFPIRYRLQCWPAPVRARQGRPRLRLRRCTYTSRHRLHSRAMRLRLRGTSMGDTKLADAKAGDNIAVTGTLPAGRRDHDCTEGARSMSPPPRLRKCGRHCFQPDRDQPADGIQQRAISGRSSPMVTRQLKPG